MQIDTLDPAYTTSERARANFRLAAKIALGFVALIWLIQLLNWGLDLELERFGVRPRQLAGLPGILFAPLLHGGFAHLVANSLPLLVLGTAMLYLYPNSALKVIPAVYLGPGIAVWLFARGSAHVGASGLVYGLVSYIFVAGLIRRDRRAIAASLLVCFLVRRPGLGSITDRARGFLGNPSGGRADRLGAGDRAAAPGHTTAQTLRLGRRKRRARGRPIQLVLQSGGSGRCPRHAPRSTSSSLRPGVQMRPRAQAPALEGGVAHELCGRFRAESEGCPDSLRSATTGRWRICHKAACQALWVYASIQYFDVPLFTIF